MYQLAGRKERGVPEFRIGLARERERESRYLTLRIDRNCVCESEYDAGIVYKGTQLLPMGGPIIRFPRCGCWSHFLIHTGPGTGGDFFFGCCSPPTVRCCTQGELLA